jgi:DNA repair and recombination protein RAD54B
MGLGEELSVNQFSDSQIRDLFRLDTDTFCQTHDLLDCKCNVGNNTLTNDSAIIPSDEANLFRVQPKV